METGNYSLADIRAVTDNNDAWGGNGSWIWFLIIVFLLAGNGNWFGGNNPGMNQITNDFLFTNLRQDLLNGFNQMDRGISNINNQLCDGFYSMNTSILTGFNGVDKNLCQGFNSVNQNIAQLGYQTQQCCCETNRSIDAVRYENSRNTCDIIQAQNLNTQKILDKLCENEVNSLRTDLQAAQLQISQLSQTSNIVNSLRPTPIPAYITCSPYAAANYNGCGVCNGCGC